MSNIQENLQKIISAVWGRDVRQAIHDAIHDCYEDGSAGATDLIAREGITTLEAEKASKTELADESSARQAEIGVERGRIDNLITSGTGVTNATKRTETTLFSASVPCFGNVSGNSGYFNLEDAIDNYDYIKIRYNAFGRTGIVDCKPADISASGTLGSSVFHWSEIQPNWETTSLDNPRTVFRHMDFSASNISSGNTHRLSIDAVVFGWNGDATSNGKISDTFTISWDSSKSLYVASGFAGGIYSIIGVKYTDAGVDKDTELTDIRTGADGTVYQTAGGAVRGQIEDIINRVDNIESNFAEEYDSTATYEVGDRCIYEGAWYECNTEISTAEEWTAGHWDRVSFGDIVDQVADNTAGVAENACEISQLKEDLNIVVESTTNWNTVVLTLSGGYYSYVTGDYTADNERRSAKIEVSSGQKYKLSTYTRPATISGIVYFDSNNAVAGHLLDGTGTGTLITDYVFTVPDGVASMAVQSGDRVQAVPQLSLEVTEKEFVGYTKSEINGMIAGVPKKYGFRYSLTDPDDLGERVFDAVGLSATIGVGSINGASDFDSIYPWSEIKRCNINKNANGAEVVTFEGETGFALDGSNGDVFVRIPKFCYSRYKSNGYEYHVISESEGNVHPAFVENGIELDEIFVGAFEAYSDGTKLHSYGGVIPSSNMLGSEFLSLAKANGNRYTLYDMRSMSDIWVLMAVEFGCRNTNQILGYGFADFVQPASGTYGIDYDGEATTTNVFTCPASLPASRMNLLLVGSNVNICKGSQTNVIASRKLTAKTSDSSHYYLTFDGDPVALDSTCFIGSAGCTTNFCESVETGALSWHTGRANWVSGSTTKNPIRYRWIENIVGSLWHIFPDIIFNNLQMYICKDMSKYNLSELDENYSAVGKIMTKQDSNGSKSDTANVNYWIDKLVDDHFNKNYIFYGGTWDTSLISTKAFGAYYYLDTGLRVVTNGGGFDHLYRCNMLTNRAWSNLTSGKWYLYGARLLYKHI